MFKCLFMCFSLLFLTACGTTPKYERLEVVNTKTEYVVIPDNLLELCIPEKPMEPNEYMKLKIGNEREEYLTNYNVSLLTTIKKCNINLKKIKKINDSHKAAK